LADFIKKNREFVITHPEYDIPVKHIKKIRQMVKKRASGFPLAYLLGQKDFYGLKFLVNKNVLIPRPETELMIEKILELVKKQNKYFSFYDIGTGSGCIIITLAKLLGKKNNYYGADIYSKALIAAASNTIKHKVNRMITFKKGHLAMPFLNDLIDENKQIVITANLPYLTKKQFILSPSIQSEPEQALVSQRNGLDHYIKLFVQLSQLKNKKFVLFCEINPNQYLGIKKIAQKNLPDSTVSYKNDYSGQKRLAIINNL
jgi:release factor glutamine methyltransferase